jgi:hypothetical protein
MFSFVEWDGGLYADRRSGVAVEPSTGERSDDNKAWMWSILGRLVFTAGTLIETGLGCHPVEAHRIGPVRTLDNGLQLHGSRGVPLALAAARADPVRARCDWECA